jgi:hypothetical protein
MSIYQQRFDQEILRLTGNLEDLQSKLVIISETIQLISAYENFDTCFLVKQFEDLKRSMDFVTLLLTIDNKNKHHSFKNSTNILLHPVHLS